MFIWELLARQKLLPTQPSSRLSERACFNRTRHLSPFLVFHARGVHPPKCMHFLPSGLVSMHQKPILWRKCLFSFYNELHEAQDEGELVEDPKSSGKLGCSAPKLFNLSHPNHSVSSSLCREWQWGTVMHSCNLSTGESEAGEFWVQCQPGLYRERLSQEREGWQREKDKETDRECGGGEAVSPRL